MLLDYLKKLNIVETRFTKEVINGVEVITHLAKGQNPVACSIDSGVHDFQE